MQVARLVNDTHLRLVIADDLDEVAHDVTEEGDAAEHDHHCDDSLHLTDGEVVTIANSAQGGESVVATDCQVVDLVLVEQVVMVDETSLQVDLTVAEIPPRAPNEVRDNDCNDNQSEDLIDVEEHILVLQLVISVGTAAAHQGFDQLREACDIDELDESW